LLPQLTFKIVTGTTRYTWETGFGYVGGGNITCLLQVTYVFQLKTHWPEVQSCTVRVG